MGLSHVITSFSFGIYVIARLAGPLLCDRRRGFPGRRRDGATNVSRDGRHRTNHREPVPRRGYDGSPSASRALDAAVALLHGRSGQIDVVYVAHLPSVDMLLPPGDKCDDAALATAANNMLALNVTVPNTVQAIARDGNLTLAGFVRNGAQRAAAEQTVAGLPWVRNVRDQIEVISGDALSDVTVVVQDPLDRYAVPLDNSYAVPLDNSKVTVSTSGHTVTLTGHMRTWAEHDAVVAAAWMAHGVSGVHDQVQVTG